MFRRLQIGILAISVSLGCFAQTSTRGFKPQNDAPPANDIQIAPGTHVLLSMINSVSTKQANVGDRMYLETAFPVLSGNRIVIPQGSWVAGTITEVKRPGRIKRRGELQVSFDSITLPNGVTRNLRSGLGALDARRDEKVDRENNKITGPGNRKGNVGTVATGAVIGSGVGGATGSGWRGVGIGAAAGAGAGVLGVLLSRGPEAMLTKGSTVEMVTDRPLTFSEADLNFTSAPPRAVLSEGENPVRTRRGWGLPRP